MFRAIRSWIERRRDRRDQAERIARDLIAKHGRDGVRLALRAVRSQATTWLRDPKLERAIYRALVHQGAVLSRADTATRMLDRD